MKQRVYGIIKTMTSNENLKYLEDEVRELILNFKSKCSTTLEPCTKENVFTYLKSVHDELALFGIRYVFNSQTDLVNQRLTSEACVKLVNALWNLVQQHKEVLSNGEQLKEQNYSLQQNNFFLNSLVDQQKRDIQKKENEIKTREQVLRLHTEKLEIALKQLALCKDDYKKLSKQKESKEMQLMIELKKVAKQYEILENKFRGQCGMYTSRNDAKLAFVEESKAREKKLKETILKLQNANRKLTEEVINLKDDLLCDCDDTYS